ncbi:MAG: YkgJ family cysteine cluster protein [Planctomycetota bacterium]
MESRDDYPFRFRCRRSGNCCSRPGGVVRVGPEKRLQIAEFLGITEVEVWARHFDPTGTRLTSQPGGACTFLESTLDGSSLRTTCRIHPVRPERCRTWPFWPELRDDPSVLAEAMRFCPGIDAANAQDSDSSEHSDQPRNEP